MIYIFRGVRLSCLSCFRVCDFYICLWQLLTVEFIWIYGIELSVHHVIPTFIAKQTNITCQNKSSSVSVSVCVCVRACILRLNQTIRKRKGIFYDGIQSSEICSLSTLDPQNHTANMGPLLTVTQMLLHIWMHIPVAMWSFGIYKPDYHAATFNGDKSWDPVPEPLTTCVTPQSAEVGCQRPVIWAGVSRFFEWEEWWFYNILHSK